jgi:hypothetical protein
VGAYYKIVLVKVAAEEKLPDRIRTTVDALKILKDMYGHLHANQEHIVVLAVDKFKKFLGGKVIATGLQNVVRTTPKDVIYAAGQLCADGIILSHNHPRGSRKPTKADRYLESLVRKIAELITLKVHDHIIVGPPARPPTAKAWTEEEVQKLLDLASEDLPPREIARALGRATQEVEDKAVMQEILLPGQKRYQ